MSWLSFVVPGFRLVRFPVPLFGSRLSCLVYSGWPTVPGHRSVFVSINITVPRYTSSNSSSNKVHILGYFEGIPLLLGNIHNIVKNKGNVICFAGMKKAGVDLPPVDACNGD